MPRSVAEEIYKSKYWDALAGDQLPAGVDFAVFDYGVNSGIGRSGRVLRAVLGLPTNNWRVTSEVLVALKSADARQVSDAIWDERLHFLMRLRTWPHFGRGWGRRVASGKAFSEHLAEENPGEAPAAYQHPAEGEDTMAKAYGDDQPITAVGVVPMAAIAANSVPLGAAPVSSTDPAATSEPPTSPPAPSMLTSKSGWAAVGLGGSGFAEGLQQFNDVASQISMAKWNFDTLNVWGILHALVQHPMFLVSLGAIGAAVFLWFDHRKYKRLVAELKAKQK